MYQNPAARLRLIEEVGMCSPILLRIEEPGMTKVVAFLSQVGSAGHDFHQQRLSGAL
jgi:hypothetical protein